MRTFIEGVQFDCRSGRPRPVQVQAELLVHPNLGRVVEIRGGVTGYESFCLDSAGPDFEQMKRRGWWACAGTPGSWDGLYFHGLQMEKLLKELGVC